MTAAQVAALAARIGSNLTRRDRFKSVNPFVLARTASIVSAVETGGTFNEKSDNPGGSARGLMQVVICTQRWMEEMLGLPFAPASYITQGTPCARKYARFNFQRVPKSEDKMLTDAEYGMTIGMAYLAYHLQQQRGDIRRSVIAYNQGSFSSAAEKAGADYWLKFQQREREFLPQILPALSAAGLSPVASNTRHGIREFA